MARYGKVPDRTSWYLYREPRWTLNWTYPRSLLADTITLIKAGIDVAGTG